MKEISQKGQEIKELTLNLFKEIKSEKDEQKIAQYRKEILELNMPIVLKKIKSVRNRCKLDYFLQIEEDLFQLLQEKLWESILSYNVNSEDKASFCTFADYYLKEAEKEIHLFHIGHGFMTEYYFIQGNKIRKSLEKKGYVIEQGLSIPEEVLMEVCEEQKISIKTIKEYIWQNIAIDKMIYFDEPQILAQEPITPDETLLKITDDETINTFLSSLSDLEKEMFEDLENLLGRNEFLHKYEKRGMTKKEINFVKNNVILKASLFYTEHFNFKDIERELKEEESEMPLQEMPNISNETKASAKSIAIDAAVELGVNNYIRTKVHDKLASMTIAEIETIIDEELKKL